MAVITRKYRSLTQWVKIAEDLAKKNGGILPKKVSFNKTGWYGMNLVICKHPKAFAHIKQSKSLDDYVKEAEQVAVANGGILPCGDKTFKKFGKGYLYRIIKRNPDSFSHIPRKPPFKTKAERLKEILELEEKYGFIPNSVWLNNNGYSKHLKDILKDPDLKQRKRILIKPKSEKRQRSLQKAQSKTKLDYLKDADFLVKKYGFIPCVTWLERNGYGYLYTAIRRHKDWFEQFPRENKVVEKARKILSKYKGRKFNTSMGKFFDRKDYEFIYSRRQAKSGKSSSLHYPELDELATEMGFEGLFDFRKRVTAEKDCNKEIRFRGKNCAVEFDRAFKIDSYSIVTIFKQAGELWYCTKYYTGQDGGRRSISLDKALDLINDEKIRVDVDRFGK